MNNIVSEKGISLVALVVTIIVLLILAGVSLDILNDSIINKAELAIAKYNEATENEKSELGNYQYYNEDLLLKGNVKVGDYIYYPVEYTDAYSNENYDASNGWRVIDDGIMDGTSGDVKIISSHIPAKFWYRLKNYNNDVNNAIDELTNNFENVTLIYGLNGSQITGDYFKVDDLSKGVTTMTLENLNYAHNSLYGSERLPRSTEALNESDDLFSITQLVNYYWIASKEVDNDLNMYCMSIDGIGVDSGMRFGIRPVIILKDDLMGIKQDDLWIID